MKTEQEKIHFQVNAIKRMLGITGDIPLEEILEIIRIKYMHLQGKVEDLRELIRK